MNTVFYFHPQSVQTTEGQGNTATSALAGVEGAAAPASETVVKPRRRRQVQPQKKQKIHGRFGYYDENGTFHKYNAAQQHYMDSVFTKLAPGQNLGADVTLEQLQAQQAAQRQAKADMMRHKFKLPIVYKGSFFENNPFYKACKVAGVPGKDAELKPYSLQADTYVTGVIFLCFFLLVYVLMGGKRLFLQKIKSVFHERERQSLFDAEDRTGFTYRVFLFLLTSFMCGLLFFDYVQDYYPDIFNASSPYILLGADVGMFIVFYLLKGILYSFVNWIFFDRDSSRRWLDVYFFITCLTGIVLFPLVLLVVYFDLQPQSIILYVGIVVIMYVIVLFYKCFSIFFREKYGFLYLIVYFCTLEIVPFLLLWKVLIVVNECLL